MKELGICGSAATQFFCDLSIYMFSGLLVPCSKFGGRDAEGQQLPGAEYDNWGCQPHAEAEYWEVYDCLGIKLHFPVSALSVVKVIILSPLAFPCVYLRILIG